MLAPYLIILLLATLSYLPSGEADAGLRSARFESNAIGYHGIENLCATRCQNSFNYRCNICRLNPQK
ncbi:unnamed protein product [Gordionus sp. m RMFG-2023]